MLVMVVFFIAFRWIHLSTPLIRLFLLVLILLLMPTTLPTAYDVYPLDGSHDGVYYTVKDCVTIDVLPRTPCNNVYVFFMVWSNFTATKCRGLVSLNQVIKEIIFLQPLKRGDLCLVLLLAVLLLILLVAPCLNCLVAVKKPPPVAFKVMCLLPITIL